MTGTHTAPTDRICLLESSFTNMPAFAGVCLVVKNVKPRFMAFLQPGGATVMGFVWIHLLLLFIAAQWR